MNLATMVLLGAALCWFQSQKPAEAAVPPAEASGNSASGPGKAIFVERCAKCHDEDAAKKLPDGTTLLERLARSKDPEARIGTRIKDAQERRQVYKYIQSVMARMRSAGSGTQKP